MSFVILRRDIFRLVLSNVAHVVLNHRPRIAVPNYFVQMILGLRLTNKLKYLFFLSSTYAPELHEMDVTTQYTKEQLFTNLGHFSALIQRIAVTGQFNVNVKKQCEYEGEFVWYMCDNIFVCAPCLHKIH